MRKALIPLTLLPALLLVAEPAIAQSIAANGQNLTANLGPGGLSGRAIQLVLTLTVLSLAPGILMTVTSFTRIVVALSLLRSGLGAQGVPHWIVLTVENKSWTEGWMLSFGQRMEGRMGLLQDVQIYDGTHNVKYLDTISAAQNPYVSEGSAAGVAVRVNIPRSQKAVFIIHVVPMAGHSVTLVPRFVPEKTYIAAMKNPYQAERFLLRFFMLATGFYAGAWIFGHMRGGWIFIAYNVLQYLMYMHNNTVLYSASPYAGELQEVLFGVVFMFIVTRFI